MNQWRDFPKVTELAARGSGLLFLFGFRKCCRGSQFKDGTAIFCESGRDRERTKVLALTHAYHGDTFKAMEVGDDEDYHFILEAYGEKKM